MGKKLNAEDYEKRAQLREIEEKYFVNKTEDLNKYLEEQKNKIIDDMTAYISDRKPPRYNDDGEIIGYYPFHMNFISISNYFFKPIVPLGSIVPIYNAEKLALTYDYYCWLIAEINDRMGDYPPSLTSFCKLAGITTSTLKAYRKSEDIYMRNIAEKILEQIGDDNLTMAMMGIASEKTTIFKVKSQNEITETPVPNININLNENVDITAINKKLDKYRMLAEKKEKYGNK